MLPISVLAFAWPAWLIGIVTVLFLAVCVVMVLTVLIQKPQGGGLASAFGGGVSAGQTAFGTKTGDALTVFTIAVFVLYLAGAIALNFGARPQPVTVPQPNAASPDGGPQEKKDAPASQTPASPKDESNPPAKPDAPTGASPAPTGAPVAPSAAPTGAPSAPPAAPTGTPAAQPPAPAPTEKPASPGEPAPKAG